jgi:hypothetical protein
MQPAIKKKNRHIGDCADLFKNMGVITVLFVFGQTAIYNDQSIAGTKEKNFNQTISVCGENNGTHTIRQRSKKT